MLTLDGYAVSHLLHFPNVRDLTLFSTEPVDVFVIAQILPNVTNLRMDHDPGFSNRISEAHDVVFPKLTSLSLDVAAGQATTVSEVLQMLKCVPLTLREFDSRTVFGRQTVTFISTQFRSLTRISCQCSTPQVSLCSPMSVA